MCTWFYAERSTLSPIITKAQQLPLANTIRNTMSRSAEMSGNIRPTDMAAVFAPNKQGNMAVFPMIWGFTVEQSSKPLINCRIETADQKPVWKDSWFRRRCVIPASWYYEWGIPPSEVGYHNANEQRNIKKDLGIVEHLELLFGFSFMLSDASDDDCSDGEGDKLQYGDDGKDHH